MTALDDYLDLVGYGQQSISFRYDIMTADLTVIGELPVVADPEPQIRLNTAAVIKRTLDLTPEPGALDGIDLFVDRIRVVAVIDPTVDLPAGAELAWGVFMFGDAFDIEADPDTEHTAILVDQSILIDQQSERSFEAPAGVPVRDTIAQFLDDLGIVAYEIGLPANPGPVEPIAWPIGSSWARAINDLSALVGGFDLYFDNNGTAQIQPAPEIDAPTVAYDTATRPRIHLGTQSSSRAPLDAPNRFIIIEGGAAETPRVGVYDVPDVAPHSFANIGRRIPKVKVVHGLCSEGFADECARVFAKSSVDPETVDEFFGSIEDYETATFTGPLDPRHDTYDVVDLDGTGWRETGWTAGLSGTGAMRHLLSMSYDIS